MFSSRRILPRTAAIFALVPLAVAVDPVDRDTSFTTITFGIGTGSYADVTRGCNGEIISARSRPIRDVGFGIEHEIGDAVLGVRVSRALDGTVRGDVSESWIANPHASYEGGGFGIGAGVLFPDLSARSSYSDDIRLPVSGHIRAGNRDRGTDLILGFNETVPLYSPGGGVEMTQGLRISPGVRARIGVGGLGPFDQIGFIARTEVRAGDDLGIELRGRFGQSGGVGESTIGVALHYRIGHE